MNNAIHDAKERQRALNPEKSFIVQAPAGSGKTELLVTRFMTMLGCVRNPEEIVAITFTIKAANEMRSRVVAALQTNSHTVKQLSEDLAQAVVKARRQDKHHGWNIVENQRRLHIQTIDSFCHTLSRYMPLLSSDKEKDIRNFNEHTSNTDSLYQQPVRALLATLRQPGKTVNALERVFRHFGCNANRLERALIDMLKKREQWLEICVGYRGQTEKMNAILQKTLRDICSEYVLSMKKHMQPWLSRLNTLSSQALDVAEHGNNEETAKVLRIISERLPKALDEQLCYWQSVRKWLLTTGGSLRKTFTKKNGCIGEVREKMISLTSEMREKGMEHVLQQAMPAYQYTPEELQVNADFINVLIDAFAYLIVHFNEDNTTDFSGVAHKALDALGNDDSLQPLAERMDQQITHILVDEFQDTSLQQLELLKRLTRGWTAHGKQSLFLVGDPQQSIYRFRQAEPTIFGHVQRHGIGAIQLESIHLSSNFRSVGQLVDWHNKTFQQLFPDNPNTELGETDYTPSVAEKAATEDDNITFFTGETQNTVYQEIAQRLQLLLKDTNIQTIAILLYKRATALQLATYLKTKNLPLSTVELERFEEQQHIIDLISIMRALTDERDSIAWLALLRHPVMAIPLQDLAKLQGETVWQKVNNPPDSLSDYSKKRLAAFVRIMQPIMERRHIRHWVQLIQDCWYHSGLAFALSHHQRRQGHNALTLATEYCHGGYMDLDGYKQALKTIAYSEQTERQKKIEIMTIHKAKGLEFDAVVLPSLEESLLTSGDKQPPLRWARLPQARMLLAPSKSRYQNTAGDTYTYLGQIHKKQDSAEKRRLLYVACTRAKKTLSLYTISKPGKSSQRSKTTSFANWLIAAGIEPKKIQNTTREQPVAKTIPVLTRYQSPDKYWKLTAQRESSEHRTGKLYLIENTATLIGIQIHEIIEQISKTPNIAELLKDEYARKTYIDNHKQQWKDKIRWNMPIDDRELAEQQIVESIGNMVRDKKGRWLLTCLGQSEWKLHSKLDSGIIQKRIIDRYFVDQGICWIVDYKALRKGDSETRNQLHQRALATYSDQLHEYARLVSQLHKLPIRLGIYLVLQSSWITWHWQENNDNRSTKQNQHPRTP